MLAYTCPYVKMGKLLVTDIARPQHFIVTLGGLMILTFTQLVALMPTWHLPQTELSVDSVRHIPLEANIA